MMFSRIRLSREYARKPLAASGRSVPAALLTTRLPSFCSHFLAGREVLDQVHLPVGDDDVGRPSTIGLDQVGDALLRVLVVAVGVHHDVGAELEGVVDAVLEGPGQALVAGVAHEVGHSVRRGRPRPCGRSSRRR